MKLAPNAVPLEFVYEDGVVFLIKPHATQYDVFQMSMTGEVKGGVLKMSASSYFETALKQFILGWQGVEDENGKPVAYSWDTFISRFPRNPNRDVFLELWKFIQEKTDLVIKPENIAAKKDLPAQ